MAGKKNKGPAKSSKKRVKKKSSDLSTSAESQDIDVPVPLSKTLDTRDITIVSDGPKERDCESLPANKIIQDHEVSPKRNGIIVKEPQEMAIPTNFHDMNSMRVFKPKEEERAKSCRKTIFVTVGTTKFDKLINKIMDKEFIKVLNDLNYTNLIIQTGMSEYEYKKGERLQFECSASTSSDNNNNQDSTLNSIKTEIYDYKQSISEDIEVADLVVGHAGAGTCLEVLRKHKKLLVVTNEDLMDNHQFELAQQLSEDKYLMASNLNDLKESVIAISRPDVRFNVFPPQDISKMGKVLDGVLP